MALYRLLEKWPADRYCLISCENYAGEAPGFAASRQLAGRYHRLSPSRWPATVRRLPLAALADAALGVVRRAREIAAIARDERCRVLLGCTGDLLDIPAACLAARWIGIPFVPYIFDDYVYQWTGAFRSIARRLEPAVFRRSRGAIVPNEYVRDEYARRYGVSPALIRNPCRLPDLAELDRTGAPPRDGEVAVVYTGAVYRAHYDAFRNLVAAMGILGRPDVRLHVYTAQPEAELAQFGISGPAVVVHPHIAESEVPKVLRRAAALFLPLAFDSPIPEVIRTSAPGKTGEYLSVGRPVLVHAPPDSYLSWYFRTHGCGAVVDRNAPDILADALGRLISDGKLADGLGRRARERAAIDFDQEKIRGMFEEHLREKAEG